MHPAMRFGRRRSAATRHPGDPSCRRDGRGRVRPCPSRRFGQQGPNARAAGCNAASTLPMWPLGGSSRAPATPMSAVGTAQGQWSAPVLRPACRGSYAGALGPPSDPVREPDVSSGCALPRIQAYRRYRPHGVLSRRHAGISCRTNSSHDSIEEAHAHQQRPTRASSQPPRTICG